MERDHARFRITENPAYCRLRPKTRKRIRIPQPPTASRCSCHPSLMPNTTPPKCKIPLQSPGLWSLQPLKSPTRFYEDPLFITYQPDGARYRYTLGEKGGTDHSTAQALGTVTN